MESSTLHEQMLERMLDNERALNRVLRLVASEKCLNDILYACLRILLSVNWLALQPKGGIFLNDEQNDELILVAENNLGPNIKSLCAKVAFGHCLCGRAAQSKKIIHAHCVDERHDTRFEGMQPHGHYNVPILHRDKVLGVIVFYLPHGHRSRPDEKAFLQNVADILSIVIYRKQLETHLEEANHKLEIQATTDALTGLNNRRLFQQRLESEIATAQRSQLPLSLIMLDIDFFKQINDNHGHLIGDEVLTATGKSLHDILRISDIAARYGGEEFVVLLPNTTETMAYELADRVRQIVAKQAENKNTPNITISVGLAQYIEGENSVSFVNRADAALYQAKDNGRDRVERSTT